MTVLAFPTIGDSGFFCQLPPAGFCYRPIDYPIPPQFTGAVKRHALRLIEVHGTSMEPTLLDGDAVLVEPGGDARPGELVIVQPPASQVRDLVVGRLLRASTEGVVLTKDNRIIYPYAMPFDGWSILGGIRSIIPRPSRPWPPKVNAGATWVGGDPLPPTPPADLMFSSGKLEALRSILDIPETELFRGRLPLGTFRARAIQGSYRHGIGRGRWLAIDPSGDSMVKEVKVVQRGPRVCFTTASQRGDHYLAVVRSGASR